MSAPSKWSRILSDRQRQREGLRAAVIHDPSDWPFYADGNARFVSYRIDRWDGHGQYIQIATIDVNLLTNIRPAVGQPAPNVFVDRMVRDGRRYVYRLQAIADGKPVDFPRYLSINYYRPE